MTTPRIVALVPMRHDSERVPGKNYRPLDGVPLFQHIVRSLLKVDAISEIVIDTDSPTVTEQCAEVFPDRVRVIPRPEHLRDGSIPMNTILLHDVGQTDADLYVQTHSTNPFLRSATIARAIETLLGAMPDNDSLFSVTRLQTRLYDAQGRPINHDPSVLLRTQNLPPVYEENSNLYLFTADTLRDRGNRIGERPLLFEIDALEATDIDDETQFTLAEALAPIMRARH